MEDFSPPLLAWYDTHKRPLPWRQEVTPYRVWVSEIMLQQTRIEAARGYFERFMAALPTLSPNRSSRERTRSTLPSTAGSGSPKAMEATAPAV